MGSRYGDEGLLAEANRVLDLAFMAANWRYTKIIGVEAYRSGLHKWPPIHEWEEQSMRVERMPDAAAAASGTTVAAPPSASSHVSRGADLKGRGHRGTGGAGAAAVEGWETAADGGMVRTEAGFQKLLREKGHMVQPSKTHGGNNCLIDSLLQALSHAGLAKAGLTEAQRRDICRRARDHLVKSNGASKAGYLAHDDHVRSVLEHLRLSEATVWRDGVQPDHIELTVTVFDRFSSRAELVPTEPVLSPSHAGAGSWNLVRHEQVSLYACTHGDGAGYHYEWMHGS